MSEKHIKKCSTPIVIREKKSKLLWDFILYQSVCQDQCNNRQLCLLRIWSNEKHSSFVFVSESEKLYRYYGNQCEGSYKDSNRLGIWFT